MQSTGQLFARKHCHLFNRHGNDHRLYERQPSQLQRWPRCTALLPLVLHPWRSHLLLQASSFFCASRSPPPIWRPWIRGWMWGPCSIPASTFSMPFSCLHRRVKLICVPLPFLPPPLRPFHAACVAHASKRDRPTRNFPEFFLQGPLHLMPRRSPQQKQLLESWYMFRGPCVPVRPRTLSFQCL